MEMQVGYARVSAPHQNLDRQLSLLKAAGCKRVFREKLSGRQGMKRPELEKAIEALGPGDVLVLATDGIGSSFAQSIAAGGSAQQIADRILAAHAKDTDDALVVVVRSLEE